MKMEAVAQKPILYRPLGITLTILAIVGLWGISSGLLSPVTVALVAVVALFLFGLRRPVWAILIWCPTIPSLRNRNI